MEKYNRSFGKKIVEKIKREDRKEQAEKWYKESWLKENNTKFIDAITNH